MVSMFGVTEKVATLTAYDAIMENNTTKVTCSYHSTLLYH
jgi:hypothetical protein